MFRLMVWKSFKILKIVVLSFKKLKIKITIFREIGCVNDTNGKPLMSGILQRWFHKFQTYGVFVSMEINTIRISGNKHWLLDVHMVNLKPFVDDISVDPKNDLKEVNL
jgi:hypothetical protein